MNYYAETVRFFIQKTDDLHATLRPIGDGIEITNKMKEFIENKGMVGFMEYIIFPCRGSLSMGLSLSKWYEVIFGTLEKFKQVLSDFTGIEDEASEFNAFVDAIGERECLEDFEFKHLKINYE